MKDWKQEVIRLRSEERFDWWTIATHLQPHFPEKTLKQCRQLAYDTYRRNPDTEPSEPRQTRMKFPEKTAWKNGVYESDRLIAISETEIVTPELILELHKLKPEAWEVVSYVNNLWHGQKKGGKRLIMYQSKLTAKPISNRVTFADVERYFEGKNYPTPEPREPRAYDPRGEVLEIDIADLHSGLLSWGKETGENYDIRIARTRFLNVIDDNVQRCSGRKFKKIIFALLGDLLHVDNDSQTTTKGTFQQADGRIAKIFDCTLDMLIEAIQMLSCVAPVDVVYTSGNHDGVSGWMLIKALEMAFRLDGNVEIDISPNPQKQRLVGETLLGFVHGDMPEKNLSGWLQVAARKLPKKITHLEVHSGHRHQLKVIERVQTQECDGVVVRTMPTICGPSSWGHREGYAGGMCTSVSFVWHEQLGLREMWYSHI